MATRRLPRDRCGFIANAAIAFILSTNGLIVACEDRDDGAGGMPDGGSLGGAGGSGGGATISCNPTGNGCLCIVDDSQPGTLTTCSPTSVAQSEMEKGVCCVAQSLCSCIRYTCRSDPGSSFCQCGSASNLATVTLGSPVAECPTPAATQKCCFSPDNQTCICSGLACAAEEMQVANCSATAAGACSSGEDIAACR